MREQAKGRSQDQGQGSQLSAPVIPTIADLIERQSPGSLQKMPEELRGMVQMMRVETSVSHSGPLPPAWELAEYCKYIPNGGDRLMAMAENQAAHRMALEKEVVPKQVAESGRGQILAAILSLSALGATGWLGYLHETTAACIVGGTTVVSLTAAFIGGKTAIVKNLIGKNPSQGISPSQPKQPKQSLPR